MTPFFITLLNSLRDVSQWTIGAKIAFLPKDDGQQIFQVLDARMVGFQDSHIKRKDSLEVVRVTRFCLLAVESREIVEAGHHEAAPANTPIVHQQQVKASLDKLTDKSKNNPNDACLNHLWRTEPICVSSSPLTHAQHLQNTRQLQEPRPVRPLHQRGISHQ